MRRVIIAVARHFHQYHHHRAPPDSRLLFRFIGTKAKTIYAERGDVNPCGYWSAVALKDAFRTDDGSFDLAAFKSSLKDRGLTSPNVDIDRHGAIGRFRMCAGLMLRRHASKVGHVVIGGKKIPAPDAKKRGRGAKPA